MRIARGVGRGGTDHVENRFGFVQALLKCFDFELQHIVFQPQQISLCGGMCRCVCVWNKKEVLSFRSFVWYIHGPCAGEGERKM